MAEWLGGLMTSWPTWLIAVAAVVILIIGASYYLYYSQAVVGQVQPLWRKKNGKK